MDPDATLRDLLEAVEERDAEQVTHLVEALKHWLENGGYPPKTIGPLKLGQDWHKTMALCVCGLARAYVGTSTDTQEGGNGE